MVFKLQLPMLANLLKVEIKMRIAILFDQLLFLLLARKALPLPANGLPEFVLYKRCAAEKGNCQFERRATSSWRADANIKPRCLEAPEGPGLSVSLSKNAQIAPDFLFESPFRG